MSDTDEKLTVDIVKFQQIAEEFLTGKRVATIGADLITQIVRVATENPNLELTIEQKRECKLLLHGTQYGMGPQAFFNYLYQNKL